MAEDRFERVTNLVTFLLNRQPGRGATFTEILEQIPGWPEGADARRRAFERDKRILRDEGIPLEEEGGRYRIPPDRYYLPDLELTDDEGIALRLATAAVRLGGDSAGLAVHKLTLGSSAADALDAAGPVVAALDEQPLLPVLHKAVRERSVVTFTYGGVERDVEPATLLFRDGFWYLIGDDRTRAAARTFRVDRIEGDVAVGPVEAFARKAPAPDAAMPRERWLIGGDPERVRAVVEVDAVLAAKAAADVAAGGASAASVEPLPGGGMRLSFDVTNRGAFRSWVLGMLDHAVVVDPPALRDDVVAWLESLA